MTHQREESFQDQPGETMSVLGSLTGAQMTLSSWISEMSRPAWAMTPKAAPLELTQSALSLSYTLRSQDHVQVG